MHTYTAYVYIYVYIYIFIHMCVYIYIYTHIRIIYVMIKYPGISTVKLPVRSVIRPTSTSPSLPPGGVEAPTRLVPSGHALRRRPPLAPAATTR